MKSLKIVSFLSVLYTLWLSDYVVESTMVKILKCDVDHPIPGSLVLEELAIADDKLTGIKLDVKQELNPSEIAVHIQVNNEDGDSMSDQSYDFCSMSSNDFCKDFFQSIEDEAFNGGSCPIRPGSFSSKGYDMNLDGAPEGTFEGVIEVLEGPNIIIKISCQVKTEE